MRIIAAFFLSLSFFSFCEAELTITLKPAKTASKGGTKVAAGNEKGQTFSLAKEGQLDGLSLMVGQISQAGKLSCSLYQTQKGFPKGDPIFSDEGTLPTGTKGLLTIKFNQPIELSPGDYAIVLASETATIQFNLDSNNPYPGGELIRKNESSKNQWAKGNNRNSDLVFTSIGTLDLATTKSEPTETVVGPTKLTYHKNPDFKPVAFDSIPKKPNLIVCMVDDLGWNQIGVSQGTLGTQQSAFTTPTLAKMAKGGLSFTHAYAQPNCAPTRAAMLSGQYPARIHNDVYVVGSLGRHGRGGISKQNARFDTPSQTEDVAAEAITVAEALKENGYQTAHIGKYHVGGHGGGEKTLPENVGFDINIGGFKQGHQPVCFANSEGKFKGLGRGDFDRFGEPYTKEYLERYNFPQSLLGTPKHVSDALSDAMEETIGTLSEGKEPFYLQVHPYAVHGPVKARPDLKKANGDSHLAGFVRSIDLIFERMLNLLNDPNLDGDTSDSIAENTLVLFTSDNGGTHGHNQPLRGNKGMFTEGGIRVPLIAYWPNVIPANTVTSHPIHTVDYYPTLLEFAGNQWMPQPDTHPLDGESFAQILLDPNLEKSREPIYYFFPGYLDKRASPCAVAIQKIEEKLYKSHFDYESESWKLYCLDDDISEQNNLVKSHPEIAVQLSQKIESWLKQEHPTWKPKYPIVKKSGESAGPPPIFQSQ